MLMADLRHDFVRGFNAMLSTLDLSVATSLIEEMSVEGHELLDDEGAPPDARDIVVSADLRYVGQHHEIILSFPTRDFADDEGRGRIAAAFHRRHEELFGFANPQADVEMLSLRVTAVGRRPGFPLGDSNDPGGVLDDALKGRRGVYLRSEARKVEVPIYDGDRLPVGQVAEGPCVIEEPQTTIFVPEFFDIILDASGSYVMYRKGRSLDELDTLGTLEGSR
jgi:N-methylhydantoinase A